MNKTERSATLVPAVGAQVERVVRPLVERMRDAAHAWENHLTVCGDHMPSPAMLRDAAAEIDRLRAIARDAEAAAVDFQREILAVRSYCRDVLAEGTANERAVAQTVSRMLSRQPAAQRCN